MSLQHRDVASRRTMITALPVYHSSQLRIKRKGDLMYAKHHAELRGNKIFLYPNETEAMGNQQLPVSVLQYSEKIYSFYRYTETLDLEGLQSMDVHRSTQKKSMPVYMLKLSTEMVQLKMSSIDAGEEWKSFILTVAKKQIPSDMKRLPGQILQLQDVLVKEKTRCFISLNPPLPARPPIITRPSFALSPSEDSDLPLCFLDVSRQEAEELLESNPLYGSIIIRPSSLASSYAVTMRQLTPSGAICKHYKVTQTSFGFIIELETPVTVPSLNSVLEYFIQVTEYRLSPFLASLYNTKIETESSLAGIIPVLPQTEAQPQCEHEKKSNISGSLPSKSSSVKSNTAEIYENENTPQVGFTRRASNLSLAELHVELQAALRSRQRDSTEFSDEEYSEWEN